MDGAGRGLLHRQGPRAARDDRLCPQGAGVPHLHGDHGAPLQDMAVQGELQIWIHTVASDSSLCHMLSSQIDCQGQYECLSVSGFIYEVLLSLSMYLQLQSLNRGHTNCVCVVVLSSFSVAWRVVSVAPGPDPCRDSNMQI